MSDFPYTSQYFPDILITEDDSLYQFFGEELHEYIEDTLERASTEIDDNVLSFENASKNNKVLMKNVSEATNILHLSFWRSFVYHWLRLHKRIDFIVEDKNQAHEIRLEISRIQTLLYNNGHMENRLGFVWGVEEMISSTSIMMTPVSCCFLIKNLKSDFTFPDFKNDKILRIQMDLI